MATPGFEGVCTDAEQRALLADTAARHGSLLSLLRPIAVFLGLSAVLALLWFGLPRLLWPERYDRRLGRPIRPEYWSPPQRPAPEAAHFVSRPPPPGFDAVSGHPKFAARAPGDKTIVQPRTEFDPNKTRLS
jgi:Ca-activated chloride channel family protein